MYSIDYFNCTFQILVSCLFTDYSNCCIFILNLSSTTIYSTYYIEKCMA